MTRPLSRNATMRLLVEQLGRHRPRWLPVQTTVQVIRRLIARAFPAERGGCIYFDGTMDNDGYARLNVRLHGNHVTIGAHRIACQLAHHGDDIPHWMEVAHEVCDAPPCIHPFHLELQRRRQNRQKSARNTNAKKAARRSAEERLAA